MTTIKQRKRIIGTDIVDVSTTCVNACEPQPMVDSMPCETNGIDTTLLGKAKMGAWTEIANEIEWFYSTFINVNGTERAYVCENGKYKVSYDFWSKAKQGRTRNNAKYGDNQVIYSTPDGNYHLGHTKKTLPRLFTVLPYVTEAIESLVMFINSCKEESICPPQYGDYYLVPPKL